MISTLKILNFTKMLKTNILIYGFGRMGITHFTILNSIIENCNFFIIEPNKSLRLILKKNIQAIFLDNDESLESSFDYTLVTTPPSQHVRILENCIKRGDKNIFIEKPFGGHLNKALKYKLDSVFIGYVLRFNPCIQWVKSNINPNNIKSIKGQYLSSTIESKPKGWRNGKYSGVCNEMGSHIIDLVFYIIGDNNLELIDSKIQSQVSDVDDIVNANLISKKDIKVTFYFNWVKKNIRKPIFNLDITMKDDYKYIIDQQQIKVFDDDKFIKNISVVDLARTIPFYLRGIDFTNQMMDFVNNQQKLAKGDEALAVNKLISKILDS